MTPIDLKYLEDYFNKSFDIISTNINSINKSINENVGLLSDNLNKTSELIINNPKKIVIDNIINPLDNFIQDQLPRIKLYYRLRLPGSRISNEKLFEDIMEPLGELSYGGYSASFMYDSTFQIINKDIVSFIGYINSGNDSVPSVYYEIISIILNDDKHSTIQAVSSYLDSGEGPVSTIDSTTYTVTAANGVFFGCKKINVRFNNVDRTRVVNIF